ncbi:MAG: copper resistance protein NlpE [Flavitalea sp.]
MKKLLIISTAIVLFTACTESGEKENNATEQSADTTPKSSPVDYQHVISAAYMGVTPCADCDGIETRVTLFADTSFQLVMNYLGKNPKDTAGLNVSEQGKFKMINDTLQFEGIKSKFIKNDTALIQLDSDGKIITGPLADKFILKKQK